MREAVESDVMPFGCDTSLRAEEKECSNQGVRNGLFAQQRPGGGMYSFPAAQPPACCLFRRSCSVFCIDLQGSGEQEKGGSFVSLAEMTPCASQ